MILLFTVYVILTEKMKCTIITRKLLQSNPKCIHAIYSILVFYGYINIYEAKHKMLIDRPVGYKIEQLFEFIEKIEDDDDKLFLEKEIKECLHFSQFFKKI